MDEKAKVMSTEVWEPSMVDQPLDQLFDENTIWGFLVSKGGEGYLTHKFPPGGLRKGRRTRRQTRDKGLENERRREAI
jgi:hypothetical protein